MATGPSLIGVHQVGLDELKRHRFLFLLLGALLIILGMVALGSMAAATIITTLVIGWMMIIGGAVEAVHAFSCKRWGGFFIDLFTGLLYLAVGYLLVSQPVLGALKLTLVIAIFLFVSGVFRIAVAITSRFQHWVWLLLSGAINIMLGALIWNEWPESGLKFIGLFIGLDMIFNGWSLVMLSLAAKRLPAA